MILDLKQLLDNQSEVFDFATSLDLSEVKLRGRNPFTTLAELNGRVTNRAGVVEICFSADYMLDTECDRCLKPLCRSFHERFSHTIVQELTGEDHDDYVVVPDGMLDVSLLARTDILLSVPTQILCEENCKGLCPVCGIDLNEKQCACGSQKGDPRFAVLHKLLDETIEE